ncbi:peptidyl-prolyl cis-trans isomerase B (cyclophilin B) [Actinokineospora cianjurensis]|uniref:Peptidyl-prolyl cis-trans isomerase n=1 Tax=Actinokineospora cianjurensis TaxID=585224 RepID=A0A421B4L8_9PSEU|nr:peptidyl-prolyl cis-trans isomerase B (cyclophilin B) [Actinokineospora cianjurensis]
MTSVLIRGVVIAALALSAAVVVPGAASAAADQPPKVTKGPCQYTETPDDPAARPVGLPRDPRHTPSRGTVKVDLPTSQGAIGLTLDRAKAPCTVQSFLHLAEHRYYDFTTCHRLTAYPTLKVLQCGDPTGTGEGGPGYKYKDELPTDLPTWPGDTTGTRKVYARGLLAMANAGPATNGSQFFLVYGDSRLLANYTVFGSVDARGLATLDKVAAGGIQPTTDNPAPVDGTPIKTTKILRAHVRC